MKKEQDQDHKVIPFINIDYSNPELIEDILKPINRADLTLDQILPYMSKNETADLINQLTNMTFRAFQYYSKTKDLD